MARAFITLAAVSRVVGVLGIPDANRGQSNVFTCELTSNHDTALVVFDSLLNEALSSVSTDIAKFYLHKATSTKAIKVIGAFDLSSVSVAPDSCKVIDSSVNVPVSVIKYPGLYIAVVAAGPRSHFFSTRAAFSTFRQLASDIIELRISDKTGAVDDKMGCLANNADRMIMERSSETSWEFGLHSIALLTKETEYTLLSDSPPKAVVSTVSEGLGFPEALYELFKTSLQSAGFQLVSGADDSTIVNGCETKNGLSVSLPDFVITFSKQEGYGVRVQPTDYLEVLKDGQCRLKIQKVSGSELVLGDAFIKSGYVELNSAQKFMMACPNKQYHLTDKAFDPKLPGADRPAPRGADVGTTPLNGVNPMSEDQAEDSTNQALVIGLTVSGVVLIIGVVAFFVIRKKRADKKKAEEARFAPSRSMIHDPSEVSSVEESVRV